MAEQLPIASRTHDADGAGLVSDYMDGPSFHCASPLVPSEVSGPMTKMRPRS